MKKLKDIEREVDYDYYETGNGLVAVHKTQWDKLNALKKQYKELSKVPESENIDCNDMLLNPLTLKYERDELPQKARVNTIDFQNIIIKNPDPFKP